MHTWLCVAHEKEIPNFENFNFLGVSRHILGVGHVNALATLSHLVAIEAPTRVLLAGTCGSLKEENHLRLFHATHFAYPSIAKEELPEFLPRSIKPQPAFDFLNLPQATVVQNFGVSLDADKFLSNTHYVPDNFPRPIVENMEATALADFCAAKKIPFSALLCVTNAISPKGRKEWSKNFHEAGCILRDCLKSILI
ncbi:MAG: Futalosine hydrolase [Turneriella sp.]|nr:Futalosine hydrolase [Turneriella sp.]